MNLLDYVAPVRCVSCRAVGFSWCPTCRPAPTPRISSLPNGARLLIGGRYENSLKIALRSWKLGGRRDLQQPLARYLAAAIASLPSEPIGLVPMPVRRSSRRRRGEDLIAGLASAVCRELGDHSTVQPLLSWNREPDEQVGQDFRRRRANLAGALHCVDLDTSPLTFIALDDIVTSGATLTSATGAIRMAGAKNVLAAAVAGGDSFPPAVA